MGLRPALPYCLQAMPRPGQQGRGRPGCAHRSVLLPGQLARLRPRPIRQAVLVSLLVPPLVLLLVLLLGAAPPGWPRAGRRRPARARG